MPTYKYEAQGSDGKKVRGFIEAENQNDLFNKLRQKGEYCISFAEAKVSKDLGASKGAKKLNTREVAIVCRQFSTMLNAGVTIIKCLDTLAKQSVKKNTKAALMGVYEGVQKGLTLSTAMKMQGSFPTLLVNMVESGEMSGSLDNIMMRMSEHFEKDYKLKAKVRNAMIYPCVLVIVGIVVVIILLTYVLPQFAGIFAQAGSDVPAITKAMLAASDFLRTKWYILIAIVAVIALVIWAVCRSESGKRFFAVISLKLPIFGKLNKTVITARFARTLSTLLASGMSLIQALEISTRVVNNAKLDEYMDDGIDKIRKGIPLSHVIQEVPVFPPMFTSMVSIGEESGALDDIMYKTANFYDEESDAAISAMVATIEPVMIVFLGIVVGLLVASVMQPMMGMYEAVANM